MSGVVSAVIRPTSVSSPVQLNLHHSSIVLRIPRQFSFNGIQFRPRPITKWSSNQWTKLQCNSTIGPGAPNPGENENKSILDAFFLGKALAEALNERIESTVGEFLSGVGRLQAEQQRQLQDLREDVLERAKRAKDKAAREAMEEAKGFERKPLMTDISVETPSASSSAIDIVSPAYSSSSSSPSISTVKKDSDNTIRVVDVSNDD